MRIAPIASALAIAVLVSIGCKKESGPPSPSNAPSCDERVDAFEKALASSTAGACTTDTDCKCYPGGVSRKHSCGGVTDTASAEKLASIAADYLKDGCKSGIDCAATMCLPSCQNGHCSDGPPAKLSPPAEAGTTCDARAAEIDRVLASATRKCSTDKDCVCFRGGVSKKEPCGGIVDAKTNERFEALARDFRSAGCKGENVACPAMVCTTSCNDGTCGPSGTVIQ